MAKTFKPIEAVISRMPFLEDDKPREVVVAVVIGKKVSIKPLVRVWIVPADGSYRIVRNKRRRRSVRR